jgi:hypothetical protein
MAIFIRASHTRGTSPIPRKSPKLKHRRGVLCVLHAQQNRVREKIINLKRVSEPVDLGRGVDPGHRLPH